jgi:hypothetical protein
MNPLLDATNKLADAILPSDHAKRYQETQAQYERERNQFRKALIEECLEAIECLTLAARSPNSARIDLEAAAESIKQAQAAAEQLSPEE